MRVAEMFGVLPEELQAKISRRQRNVYLTYMEWRDTRTTADQLYMAQIAQVMHNKPTLGYKRPKQLAIKDKLIPLQFSDKVATRKKKGPPAGVDPVIWSKAAWFGATGCMSPIENKLSTGVVHG